MFSKPLEERGTGVGDILIPGGSNLHLTEGLAAMKVASFFRRSRRDEEPQPSLFSAEGSI